jgi:hypothetical protein
LEPERRLPHGSNIFWHFGFAVAVIGYVLLKDAKSPIRYSAVPRLSGQ